MAWPSRFDRPLGGLASLSSSGEGEIDLDGGSPSSDNPFAYCECKKEVFLGDGPLPTASPKLLTADALEIDAATELASGPLEGADNVLDSCSVRMVRDAK
jgi:hypothetical protein